MKTVKQIFYFFAALIFIASLALNFYVLNGFSSGKILARDNFKVVLKGLFSEIRTDICKGAKPGLAIPVPAAIPVVAPAAASAAVAQTPIVLPAVIAKPVYDNFVECTTKPCVVLKQIRLNRGDSMGRYADENGIYHVFGANFQASKLCNDWGDVNPDNLPVGYKVLICGWADENQEKAIQPAKQDVATPVAMPQLAQAASQAQPATDPFPNKKTREITVYAHEGDNIALSELVKWRNLANSNTAEMQVDLWATIACNRTNAFHLGIRPEYQVMKGMKLSMCQYEK